MIARLDGSHAAAALEVAARAIRRTEGTTYSEVQVEAWLSGLDEDRLRSHFETNFAMGTFAGDRLLGFATFVETTHVLDHLFVDPDAWRQGLGRSLVGAIEQHARSLGSPQVRVDASRLARPMFETMGYTIVEEHRKEVRGAFFDNAWLSKSI